MNKKVDIIIVNWNSGKLLLDCVESILNTNDLNENISNILVVDNNSNDNSISLIEKYKHEIIIINNNINLGFGKACNIGSKFSNSEFILFLNPDTRILDNSILEGVTFLEKNSEIFVLGCLQLGIDNKILHSCANLPNFSNSFNWLSGLSKINNRLFPDFHLNKFDYNKSNFVEHVMGSFYLIRRKIFMNLSGFDEDYFVYQEDTDLSKRISHLGQNRIFYNSEIKIYHESGGTSKNILGKRIYYSISALLIYSKKHFEIHEYYLIKIFGIFISPFLRLIFSISKLSYKDVKSCFVAYYYLYQSIFKNLYKKIYS
jgi:GT2 family glycosyltransferase